MLTLSNTLPYQVSTGRSDIEIDQDLSGVLEIIRADVQKSLSLRKIVFPYSKQLFSNVVEEPVQTAYKLGFCAATSYITYILTRGIFAGIEVDNDTNFLDLFSSNKTIRLNTGLNLTNGDQAGQFIIDGLALSYVTVKLIFQESYHKTAGQVINNCYKTHLIKLLTSLDEIKIKTNNHFKENDFQPNYELIKTKENIDRLYKRLKEDLKPYGEEPIFYREIIYNPFQENEKEIIEIGITDKRTL